MITVTAFKWVPKFAQGQVRDHRVRWILNEAGWPHEVRLIDLPTQASAAYRAGQPFGQGKINWQEVNDYVSCSNNPNPHLSRWKNR